MAEPLRVLHVDDDEGFLTLSERLLGQEHDDITVERASEPDGALALVVDGGARVDCVVTDYEMPTMDGIELLESIRAERPDLPVILFTGKGSEEVASEAIATGVTDYLQKESGTEQFAILANRIRNAVSGHRARRERQRIERRFRKLVQESVDVVAVLDAAGTFEYLSPAAESELGYRPATLVGENAFEYIHPADRERAREALESLVRGARDRTTLRCQFRGEDGSWIDLDVRARDRRDDPDIGGVLVYGQDAAGRILRERELERYETMVNESGDPIYTTDDDGRLVSVNEAASAFLGYPREELIGEHVSFLLTEASFERGLRVVGELRESVGSEGVTLEQEFVTADGETLLTEAHVTLLQDSEGGFRGTVGVVRDISRRKERESTLRALHDATHDLVAAESRGEVVDVLVDTAKNVIGLPLVGLWLYDPAEDALLPEVYPDDPAVPDDPPVYREGDGLSWEAFADGESRAFGDVGAESERYNPETSIGSELVVPVGDHGVLNSGSTEKAAFDETDRYLADILARTAAVAFDRLERQTILERLHAATRALMEAGDRQEIAERAVATARDVLGHEYVVVRLVDDTERELAPVASTERARADTDRRPRYRPGEGTASAAFERGETMTFDTQTLADGVERRELETTLCVPIGEHGVLTVADTEVDAFEDPDIQFAEILAANAQTALDRVDHEAALARQNERLAEFADVASHDLRNPLNVALTQVEILRDGRDDDGLDRLERALERMDDIIDDVLSLARGGEDVVDPEPLPTGSVVRVAWSTVDTRSATLEVEDDVGEILADRSRLRQALENLFRNSVEHGGEDVAVRVGSLDAGLYVEDDGPGIDAGDRGAVFESGYTTSRGGTGFGLTIVKRIADAHGWDVSLERGESGGTRVEIRGVERV